jgi:hypothetical protein
MNTPEMMKWIWEAPPRLKARIAGVSYLITFVTGILALVLVRGRLVVNLIATVLYLAVTLLFYDLFKPVSKHLSLIAALFSLAGCAFGALAALGAPLSVNPLVFFGFYCLLIGYLIFRSTFLPRLLGVLMAFGGLGWLTFLSPPLARSLAPYNLAPGMFGEGVLTVWLLVKGVDAERWSEQAGMSTEGAGATGRRWKEPTPAGERGS